MKIPASDRRRFLLGATGSVLAIPMLESLGGKKSWAQSGPPPKRLIIIHNKHGRTVGNGLKVNGVLQDIWSPGSVTGPLPTGAPSPLLEPLAAIRNEIVTIDGIDNIVRHGAMGANSADGHRFATLTSMTCVLPKSDKGGGASIDYVAGTRLRANASMPATALLVADSGNYGFNGGGNFWGEGGTPPNVMNLDADPATAIKALFSKVVAPGTPPPTPELTTRDRLVQRRASILDDVTKSYVSMRGRVSKGDQARLDQHLQFIRDAETRFSTKDISQPTLGCNPPKTTSIPNWKTGEFNHAQKNNITCPIIMQSLVQAVACDVVRSVTAEYWMDQATFDWQYPQGSPFVAQDWHQAIHSSGAVTNSTVANIKRGTNFHAEMFTSVVQGLAATADVDGSRMLDNTLVMWMSDLGYGAAHACFNYPVVLAGMKGAFTQGQGRHLVVKNRASLGDLYAQVLRMLGGTDMTFGATGTLASLTGSRTSNCNNSGFCVDYGFPGHITPDTPLHSGPLEL